MIGQRDGRDSDDGECETCGGGDPLAREARGATGVGWGDAEPRAGGEREVMGGPVGRRAWGERGR